MRNRAARSARADAAVRAAGQNTIAPRNLSPLVTRVGLEGQPGKARVADADPSRLFDGISVCWEGMLNFAEGVPGQRFWLGDSGRRPASIPWPWAQKVESKAS